MSGASANTSLDSFDFSKYYDGCTLQQGVPVLDSDWNEQNDIRRIHEIVNNIATIGSTKIYLSGDHNGFDVHSASSPTNNFQIFGGWAMVQGVLVPTTNGTPPASIDYVDQIMFTGTVTAIGGPGIFFTDTDKAWASSHVLTGCRVKMTSGAESGNYFTVTSLTGSTQLNFASIGGILANDTYEIYPPALTTPSGSARTDKVYLQVWFDDINDNEDANIVNPGVGIETCHRTKRSWCVRVSEGGVTPSNSYSDIYGFGPRYLELATLSRDDGDATISASDISNVAGTKNLSALTASDIIYDTTSLAFLGYTTSTTVQGAVDYIASDLASTSASKGIALIGNRAISGTVDSLSAGTVYSQLASLVSQMNSRVRNPNSRNASYLTSNGPELVWRSHNVSSNANVTKDTISWYVSQNSTIGAGGAILIVCGGYIDGSNCYKAPSGAAPASVTMTMFSTGSTYFFAKTSVGSAWAWDSISTWEYYSGWASDSFNLHDMDLNTNNGDIVLTNSQLSLSDSDCYIKPGGSNPRRVVSLDDSGTPGSSRLTGMWADTSGVYFLHNCHWNGSAFQVYNASYDARAFTIDNSGIFILTKATDDTISTPWTTWTATMQLGGNSNTLGGDKYYSTKPIVSGRYYEICQFFCVAVSSSSSEIDLGTQVPFSASWEVEPDTLTEVMYDGTGGLPSLCVKFTGTATAYTFPAYDSRYDGIRIGGTSNGVSGGDETVVMSGYVIAYVA